MTERQHATHDLALVRLFVDALSGAEFDWWFARNPANDADIARRVDSMSADMMHVGKILHRFITAYARATWTQALHAQLQRDIRVIGEVLAHRIHEEEKILYPLYAPPRAN